ncbi:MurR/RpiR family transcriptional regulator [Salinicoccus roseus]|uniref:MurR/RpiR family transcriptional regulator n=1 Tax=Salinicoccus roseus TaxID=45670 RepID=UPI0023003D2C|nr:MurR/RpiR family transcriptional regulator [Salinicoccus roseus]
MEFQDLIKENYSSLSGGQKKVAEYGLSNSFEFSISTLAQIAKKADVSETTVVRFAYALGFDTFSSLQKSLKSQYISKQENEVNSLEDKQLDSLEISIKKDIQILQSLMETIDTDKVNNIANLLRDAKEIRIAGYRASYSAAHWFYTKLNMMRRDVLLVSSDNIYNSPDNLLTSHGKKSVFFLLSFPSYIKETLMIANLAKQQGATIIVITDRHLSPVGRIGDISLEIDINVNSENLISVASVHSVLNYIATRIELSNRNLYNDRFKKINSLFRENDIYLE